MASVTVNWTPVITNSVNQEVQYKLDSSSTWLTYATISPMDSSIVIDGLTLNAKYNIRIINHCINGGAPSYPIDIVMLGCPTVILTPEREKINYTFPGSIENITSYIVQLISTSNTIVQTQTKTPAPTITGVFTGLTPGTVYNVRVVIKSGLQTKICGSNSTTTLITFCNDEISEPFTRNNCGEGYTGTEVIYTVEECTYQGDTQGEADDLALDDILANGQNYANEEGGCIPEGEFCNVEISGNVSKDCEEPLIGTFGPYTYAAGQICAPTFEEAQSLAEIQWSIQSYEYANTSPIFICDELQTRPCGNEVLYNSAFAETPYNISYGIAGTAINKFIDISFDTQSSPDKFLIYADGVLRHNTGFRGDPSQQAALDAALIADGLPPELIVGDSVFTVRLFKTWTSNIVTINFVMPIDDSTATIQSSCLIDAFGNTERCGTFYSEVCEEGKTPVAYNFCIPADTYWAESVEEANALRDADFITLGQAEANDDGLCSDGAGNEPRCEEFLSEDCPDGTTPQPYEYCVPMNTYFAPTLAEANALRDADIAANGQNEANTNGECLCDLELTFVSKTDETAVDANDGSITVTGSTTFSGGFVLSKDNGATFPYTGTSPYTFTGLAPGTYNIKARNADGSCPVSISAIIIEEFVPPLAFKWILDDLEYCETTEDPLPPPPLIDNHITLYFERLDGDSFLLRATSEFDVTTNVSVIASFTGVTLAGGGVHRSVVILNGDSLGEVIYNGDIVDIGATASIVSIDPTMDVNYNYIEA